MHSLKCWLFSSTFERLTLHFHCHTVVHCSVCISSDLFPDFCCDIFNARVLQNAGFVSRVQCCANSKPKDFLDVADVMVTLLWQCFRYSVLHHTLASHPLLQLLDKRYDIWDGAEPSTSYFLCGVLQNIQHCHNVFNYSSFNLIQAKIIHSSVGKHLKNGFPLL